MSILKSYSEGKLTSLNSLKYKQFGDGAAPLITKRIPTTITNDGPGSGDFVENAVDRRFDDVSRLVKLLKTSSGLQYLGKEALLNIRSNPDKEKGLSGRDLGLGLFNVVKTIGSTLAQVAVNGTGIHFIKGFRGRNTYLNQQANYVSVPEYQAKYWRKEGEERNTIFSNLDEKPNLKWRYEQTESGQYNAEKKRFIPNGERLYTSYGREDGFDKMPVNFQPLPGVTPITVTAQVDREYEKISRDIPDSTYDISGSEVRKVIEERIQEAYYTTGKFSDIIEIVPKLTSTNTNISLPKKSLDNRLNFGIKTNIYTPDISSSYSYKDNIDKLNYLPPTSDSAVNYTEDKKDIIKLRFQVIVPNQTPQFLNFRAYLDSFADSYSGNWNSFNYVGRGEQFHTYNNFDRNINFSFKIAVQTQWEMRPIYQKIAYLASTTAPTYSGQGYMRGTLVKLSLGDYLYELPGFLSSVQYDWQTDYPWEINLESDLEELPTILNCSVTFKPIHTFTPQTGTLKYMTKDFIDSSGTPRTLLETKDRLLFS